ncbi:MAG: hypothetical protein JSS10_00355 [Verrucomicrobia bacterium]|nr:hypothetical protein [Verrucomicrobiota bacterium]
MAIHQQHYYFATGFWGRAHDLCLIPWSFTSNWFEDATENKGVGTLEKNIKLVGSLFSLISVPLLMVAFAIDLAKREIIPTDVFKGEYNAWKARVCPGSPRDDAVIIRLIRARVNIKDCRYQRIFVHMCCGGEAIRILNGFDGIGQVTVPVIEKCDPGRFLFIAYPARRATRLDMLGRFSKEFLKRINVSNDILHGNQDQNSLALKKYLFNENSLDLADRIHAFWLDSPPEVLRGISDWQRLIEILTSSNKAS